MFLRPDQGPRKHEETQLYLASWNIDIIQPACNRRFFSPCNLPGDPGAIKIGVCSSACVLFCVEEKKREHVLIWLCCYRFTPCSFLWKCEELGARFTSTQSLEPKVTRSDLRVPYLPSGPQHQGQVSPGGVYLANRPCALARENLLGRPAVSEWRRGQI